MSVDTREPVVDDGDIGPQTRNGHLIPRLAARWASGGCRVYARVPPSSTNPATAAATANNVRVCEVSGRVCCGAAGLVPPRQNRVSLRHICTKVCEPAMAYRVRWLHKCSYYRKPVFSCVHDLGLSLSRQDGSADRSPDRRL